ncbi:MAG TPA: Uma2 family endonuclease, partial [Lachnospiraceae bacterium]|nr:Uma2 family endonuclease [Lachnospiraceae bacterium]
AGVREYWIVDPGRENIFVYHMEEDQFSVGTYTFRDCVRAGIFEDFSVDFAGLDL